MSATALRAELAVARTRITVVDVRELDEAGGIPGAVRAPLSRLRADPSQVPQGDVVLYCARGVRSETAAGILASAGRSGVRTLAGGLAAWEATSPSI